jgi:hypothetical protein
VNFILSRFGPDRFIQLYTTCRRATFADDCRRILGITLDELDTAYRAEVARLATGGGALASLQRLELGPDIARAEWVKFLVEAALAEQRLRAAADLTRLTAVIEELPDHPGKSATEETQRLTLAKSGPFRSLRIRTADSEVVYLAHPKHSLEAHRFKQDGPWEINDDPTLSLQSAYRRAAATIDHTEDLSLLPPALSLMFQDIQTGTGKRTVVTRFERSIDGGRPLFRIRIEDRSPSARPKPWRAVTFHLAVDELLVVQSFRYEDMGNKGATLRCQAAYDRHEGIPVLRSIKFQFSAPGGVERHSQLNVIERTFGPIPEADFTPERLMPGPRVHAAAEDSTPPPTSTVLTKLYQASLLIGVVCLIGGIVTHRAGDAILSVSR